MGVKRVQSTSPLTRTFPTLTPPLQLGPGQVAEIPDTLTLPETVDVAIGTPVTAGIVTTPTTISSPANGDIAVYSAAQQRWITGSPSSFGIGGGGAASTVTTTPAGGLSSTDVQSALNELDAEKASIALAALNSPAGSTFGLDPANTDGTLNQPWKPAAVLSAANLATPTSALPFSTTSTATGQTVRAARADLLAGGRVSLPPAARVYFKISVPATSANFGGATVVISQRDSNGNALTGGDTTIGGIVQANLLNYQSQEEVTLLGSTRYIDINFVFPNNYTGTVTLHEIDVRLITDVGLRLKAGCTVASADTASSGAGGAAVVDRPSQALDGQLMRLRTVFGLDGVQEIAYVGSSVFRDAKYPSVAPGSSPASGSSSNLDINQVVTAPAPIHANNNDLIMNVEKASSPGVYELRGNVHGGENGRTGTFYLDYIFEYDRGDGVWLRMHGDGQQVQAYRTRYTLKTKLFHSDATGTPFANIDRVYTTFADGVTRCDRTITFLTTSKVERFFYVMNSIGVDVMNFLGRIGRGQKVLREMNCQRPTANSGGVVVNGSHASGVTALNVTAVAQLTSPGWIGSLIKIGTGGTAEIRRVTAVSSTTLTLDTATANSHSTGEAVVQLDDPTTTTAASAAGATTLTLTDTVPRNAVLHIDSGQRREIRRVTGISTAGSPYTVTLDFALDASHASGTRVQPIVPGDDSANDGRSEWCAYIEPEYNGVFGQIFDRAAIQAHGLGGTLTTNLVRNTATNYIAKAYTFLALPAPVTIASGTVLSDTFYWHYYVPRDTARFHDEIAAFATATAAQRAAMYPAT